MRVVITIVDLVIVCALAPFTPVKDAARYGFLTEEHASRPVHRGLSTPIFFALTPLLGHSVYDHGSLFTSMVQPTSHVGSAIYGTYNAALTRGPSNSDAIPGGPARLHQPDNATPTACYPTPRAYRGTPLGSLSKILARPLYHRLTWPKTLPSTCTRSYDRCSQTDNSYSPLLSAAVTHAGFSLHDSASGPLALCATALSSTSPIATRIASPLTTHTGQHGFLINYHAVFSLVAPLVATPPRRIVASIFFSSIEVQALAVLLAPRTFLVTVAGASLDDALFAWSAPGHTAPSFTPPRRGPMTSASYLVPLNPSLTPRPLQPYSSPSSCRPSQCGLCCFVPCLACWIRAPSCAVHQAVHAALSCHLTSRSLDPCASMRRAPGHTRRTAVPSYSPPAGSVRFHAL